RAGSIARHCGAGRGREGPHNPPLCRRHRSDPSRRPVVEPPEIPHNGSVRTTIVLLAAAALLGATGAAAAQKHQSATARFRASVAGATRLPFAGPRWRYSVRAVNANGRAVAASALVQVLVDRRPLDTIGQFGFKGTLRRSYRWSTTWRGLTAVLQAKVTGPGGIRTVRFP